MSDKQIDVVVVSYNSASTLRQCVEPLLANADLNVIVVDNDSTDDSVASIEGLGAQVIALDANNGFAYGCNRGWEAGSAPYALFVNPDARIDADSLRRLVSTFEAYPSAGLVAPKIVDDKGSLEFSQRRFPQLRSTFAQALFLHRPFPKAAWSDELVRDPRAYDTTHPVEWLSGACVLVRRSVLEEVGGWNEAFFMYGEDKDLCFRLRAAGYESIFVADALAVHVGGVSRPREQLLPTLAASTIRYAQLHETPSRVVLTRVGVALSSLTHAALTNRGSAARAGHLRAAGVACSWRRERAPAPADKAVVRGK